MFVSWLEPQISSEKLQGIVRTYFPLIQVWSPHSRVGQGLAPWASSALPLRAPVAISHERGASDSQEMG